jgi:hypothetical protein
VTTPATNDVRCKRCGTLSCDHLLAHAAELTIVLGAATEFVFGGYTARKMRGDYGTVVWSIYGPPNAYGQLTPAKHGLTRGEAIREAKRLARGGRWH